MIAFSLAGLFWLVSLFFIFACAIADLKERIIPNRFVAVIALAGFAHAIITAPGMIWLTMLVAFLLILSLGILSHYQIIGGGDVKMISAVSLLVPPSRAIELLAEIALAGGLLGCFYLAVRYAFRWRRLVPACQAIDLPEEGWGTELIAAECKRIVAGCSLPYAVAVLGGVCIFIARG